MSRLFVFLRTVFAATLCVWFCSVAIVVAEGNSFRTVKAGSWCDSTVWAPAGIPSAGDVATVAHALSIPAGCHAIIGDNRPAYNYQIPNAVLSINAPLTIEDGASLTLHGNVMQAAKVAVTGLGAGRIIFDSTDSDTPEVGWRWGIGDRGESAPLGGLILRGTATRRFLVQSVLGAGNGAFAVSSLTLKNGYIDAEYADFLRVGNREQAAFEPFKQSLRLHQVRLYQCGRTTPAQDGLPDLASSFTVTNTQFINPLSNSAVKVGTTYSGPAPTGRWEVSGNDIGGKATYNAAVTVANNRHRAEWWLNGVKQNPSPLPYPTGYTVEGPTDIVLGRTATYTLRLSAGVTTSVTVTVTDGEASGSFSRTTVTISPATPTATIQYTPSALGEPRLTFLNDQFLFDPVPLELMVTTPATTYALTAPATRIFAGFTSDPFTVGLLPYTVVSSPVTVTLSDGGRGGLFTPSTVTLTNETPRVTFLYKPTTAGPTTITATDNAGLTDPPLPITVHTPVRAFTASGPSVVREDFPSLPFTVEPQTWGTFSITPSDGAGGTFTPATLTWTNSSVAKTFRYTPASVGRPTITFTTTGGLASPAPLPVEVKATMVYYVTNQQGNGMGTASNPFRLGDLRGAAETSTGIALDILAPGDTLYFRGGEYHFDTSVQGGLQPARSGLEGLPITIEATKGESVVLRHDAGAGVILGTERGGCRSWISIKGFTVYSNFAKGSAGVKLCGDYNEAAFNHFIGGPYLVIGPNYSAIRIDYSHWSRIHHNLVENYVGPPGWGNGIGVLLYYSEHVTIEDNLLRDNTTAMYDKSNDGYNIFRRNLARSRVGIARSWEGTGYIPSNRRPVEVYDNIFDGIAAPAMGDSTKFGIFRDNILVHQKGLNSHGYNVGMWNNILISRDAAVDVYVNNLMPFPTTAVERPLDYMDYNFYMTEGGVLPSLRYFYQFNLSQMQGHGFEQHSRALPGGASALFSNPTTFELRTDFLTAGRDGTRPGPDRPALLLDTRRYGPTSTERESDTPVGPSAPRSLRIVN